VGAERTLITDHPETLLVKAKRQVHRICDAELTLASLPEPGDGYERSAPPRVRQPLVCFGCGAEGHIARYCPERDDDCGDETRLMDHAL
jgi:6-phosphogluconolactonase/glucosamine-6-phosphate isomerase/deaminase